MARHCSNCGKIGHYVSTCAKARVHRFPADSEEYRARHEQLRRDRLAAMTPAEREALRAAWRARNARTPVAQRRLYDRQQRERAKAYLATPEGREEHLADVRVRRWWDGLLSQLKARIKSRKSGPLLVSGINARWLKEQYLRQDGRCFYTGIPFEIVREKRGMRRPSLDRRDSSKGYTPDNCVLCLTAINYLKNDYPEEQVIALLWDIVEAYR